MRHKNVVMVAILLTFLLIAGAVYLIIFNDSVKTDNSTNDKDAKLTKNDNENPKDTKNENPDQPKTEPDKKLNGEDEIEKPSALDPEPKVEKKPEVDEAYKGTGKIYGRIFKGTSKEGVKARIQLLDFETSADLAPVIIELESDDKGNYEINEIMKGKYKVAAYIDDYGFATSDVIKLRTGEKRYVEVTINEGYKIFGTVTDPDGNAVEGAKVACVFIDMVDDTYQSMNPNSVLTDAEGKYEFNYMNVGGYWMQATHDAYATSTVMFNLSQDYEQNFELQIGGAIHGFVKNENGEPVTKFKAKCCLDEGESNEDLQKSAVDKMSAQYKTFESETGEFLFSQLEPNSYLVEILAEGYAQTVEKPIKVNSTEITEVEIVMSTGITLNGIVKEQESGNPIAGARVAIAETLDIKQGDGVYEYPFAESRVLVATTDEEGKFSIAGLPKKLLNVWITHDEFPQLRTTVNFKASVLEQYEFFMVADSSMVYGTVYDSEGQPVKGKLVMIQKTDTQQRKNAMSDADGNYKIEKIAPGEYLIILITGMTTIDQIASFNIKKGEQIKIDLGVEEGIKVSGEVTQNGKPIASRQLLFTSKDKDIGIKICNTDKDGKYSVVLTEPGGYNVLLQGYNPAKGTSLVTRFELNVPEAVEYVHNFEVPMNEITGRVYSESTNQPVNKAFVLLESMSSKGSQESLYEITESYSGQGRTNENGEFSISDVSEGSYRLKIVADGQAVTIKENIVVSSGVKDIGKIYMKPETRMTGFVTDEAGNPIAGASLVVSNADGLSLAAFIPLRTNKEGKYVLGGLSEGSYNMLVYAEGYARKTVSNITVTFEAEKTLNITLEKGASLTTYVKDSTGKLMPNVSIKIYGNSGSVKPLFGGMQNLTPPGLTDITGKSVRKSLQPGLYTIEISKDGYVTQRKKVSLSSGLDTELEIVLLNQ